MAYVIKIAHRVMHKPVKYGYYSLTGTFTKNKAFSRAFESYNQATNHVNTYKMIWADDDAYIINEENDIGTYFSTYDSKRKRMELLINIFLIPLLPVIILIELYLRLQSYIMELIGKEYR
jgi:hypothetical protein